MTGTERDCPKGEVYVPGLFSKSKELLPLLHSDPVFVSVPGQDFRGNPYFSLLIESLQQTGASVVPAKSVSRWFGRPVVLLMHFPDHCVTEPGLARSLARTLQHVALFLAVLMSGGRIVWFVHDVHPFRQRRRWLLRPFMALFARIVAARVFLSRTSREQFYQDNPGCHRLPDLLLPHGPYRTACGQREGDEFRQELGVSENRILVGFLGTIKKYKNVRALEALPSGVSVLMAGKCDKETAGDALLAEVALDGRLTRIDSPLSDFELERAIRACDIVMIPYLTGYNSGMALLCLTCCTPVLTSRLPIFEELQADFGSHWVRTFAAPEELPAQLEALAGAVRTARERDELQALLDTRSFARSASMLAEFCAQLHR